MDARESSGRRRVEERRRDGRWEISQPAGENGGLPGEALKLAQVKLAQDKMNKKELPGHLLKTACRESSRSMSHSFCDPFTSEVVADVPREDFYPVRQTARRLARPWRTG